jgi:hypothetical protein
VIAFVAYHVAGAREHGGKYIKQFLGSVVFLYPLMFVVEIFSHLFRPVSLGIRLFANMTADHEVVRIFTELTYAVVPVIFYVLGGVRLGRAGLRLHDAERHLHRPGRQSRSLTRTRRESRPGGSGEDEERKGQRVAPKGT